MSTAMSHEVSSTLKPESAAESKSNLSKCADSVMSGASTGLSYMGKQCSKAWGVCKEFPGFPIVAAGLSMENVGSRMERYGVLPELGKCLRYAGTGVTVAGTGFVFDDVADWAINLGSVYPRKTFVAGGTMAATASLAMSEGSVSPFNLGLLSGGVLLMAGGVLGGLSSTPGPQQRSSERGTQAGGSWLPWTGINATQNDARYYGDRGEEDEPDSGTGDTWRHTYSENDDKNRIFNWPFYSEHRSSVDIHKKRVGDEADPDLEAVKSDANARREMMTGEIQTGCGDSHLRTRGGGKVNQHEVLVDIAPSADETNTPPAASVPTVTDDSGP